MIDYNSFFTLSFFTVERSSLYCSYIYDHEKEYYKVNGINLISDLQENGNAWTSLFASPQNGYDINMLYSNAEYFTKATEMFNTKSSPNYSKELQEYLILYQELCEYHPFFLMFYEHVYQLVHKALLNGDITNEKEILYKHLTNFLYNYKRLFKYVQSVLVLPYKRNINASTGQIIILYERYLAHIQEKSPYYYQDINDLSDWESSMHDIFLREFLKNNINSQSIHADYDFSLEFSKGIDEYIQSNHILRQCPVCMGYFKTKAELSITYCNRIYKDNLSCRDIGIANKYKEKLETNPIYAEYRKYYSRIKTRIRRNTLTEENAHLDELKSLEILYERLYTSASENQKDDIMKEFLQEMNNLYL